MFSEWGLKNMTKIDSIRSKKDLSISISMVSGDRAKDCFQMDNHSCVGHPSTVPTDLDCRKLSQPGQLCRLSWMYMSQSRQKNCLHFGQETQGAGMFPTAAQADHDHNSK